MKRIPLKSGDEYDAFSKRARKFLHFGRGLRKCIKRGYRKRFRQAEKRLIRDASNRNG